MLYLAYGSNLHPDRLAERIAAVSLAGRADLQGWELRWHKRGQDGSGKCNIVPQPRSRVAVAVFRIDAAQLSRLDRVEGRGAGYEHRYLRVPGYGVAVTYCAAASHVDDSLAPFEWYRELVTAGCEHHGFDADYVDRIRRQPFSADPDTTRYATNMALVRRLRAADRVIAGQRA